MKKFLQNKWCVAGLALSVAFVALTVLVFCGVTQGVDERIMRFVYALRGKRSERTGVLYWIHRILTEFGDAFILIPLCILALLWGKLDLKSLFLTGGLGVIWVVNKGLKLLLSRHRPDLIYQMMDSTSSSFPSGHAMSATFFFGFVAYLFYTQLQNKKVEMLLTAVCLAMPVIVGWTRIFLGMHYTTDVLSGVCLSGAITCFAIPMYAFMMKNGRDGLRPYVEKFLQRRKEN